MTLTLFQEQAGQTEASPAAPYQILSSWALESWSLKLADKVKQTFLVATDLTRTV